MKWYRNLYIGEGARKKQDRIIGKLKIGAGLVDVWLITEAANGVDLFDIIHSGWLKQPALRRNLPPVIGIAKGYEEAVEMVQEIIMETFRTTGGLDVRKYLAERK